MTEPTEYERLLANAAAERRRLIDESPDLALRDDDPPGRGVVVWAIVGALLTVALVWVMVG